MALEIKDAKQLEFLWRNNGQLGEGQVTIEDALSVPNAPMLMPKVISNIVKEAAEPLLVGTSLLQRINYSYGQTITFPAVGALVAADIAEGMEYPERSLQMGGSTVTASIGKSGVAVKVTDENGPIKRGDLLTTSSKAGYAMKWTLVDVTQAEDFEELKSMLAENGRRRNAVVAKALENLDSGEGKIMALVNLQ